MSPPHPEHYDDALARENVFIFLLLLLLVFFFSTSLPSPVRRFFRVFRRRVYSIHRANSNTRVPRIVRERRGRGGGQPWKSVQIKSESSSDPLSDAPQHSWRACILQIILRFYCFI